MDNRGADALLKEQFTDLELDVVYPSFKPEDSLTPVLQVSVDFLGILLVLCFFLLSV